MGKRLLVGALCIGGCAALTSGRFAKNGPPPHKGGIATTNATIAGSRCRSSANDARYSRIWGLTVDDVAPLDDTIAALGAFACRPTARVVFDEGQSAAYYRAPLAAIHKVSDVMGEILDSQYVADVDREAYARRTREYVDALAGDVDVWEIGNEVNGEWLGATSDVVAKVSSAYAIVKERRRPVALTLHYDESCGGSPEHGMFAWAEANVPEAIKRGVDYVLVSYYEDDCDGRRPDWNPVFHRLAQIFPSASLGFGECGTAQGDAAEKGRILERWYRTEPDEPRFVGGYFWWYFSEDMVPRTRPLWSTLNGIMLAR